MKKKSSKLRLPYFFGRQIHRTASTGKMPELIKPEAHQWQRAESVIEDLLRWADDGGQMLDVGNPVYPSNSDLAEKQANEG